jgi:hypothetical protein
MPALIALALSVGVLAVIDTWLFFGPLAATALTGLVWISFVSWGCHFQSGGGTKGSTAAAVCMSWGAVVGMGAVMLNGHVLSPALGDPLGVSVAVGIGAAVICLSSAISLLSTIPASVYGFAMIAGPIVLRGDAPEKAILPTIGAIVIGVVFGYVSEVVANALTKKAA